MPDIWIEAALNGPWGRERQPGIPVAVAEVVADGIAAAESGAAIVHVHAYDEASGRQRDDWEIYARIIEGIRAKVDCIVYPTVPLRGSGFADRDARTPSRFAHLDELGRRGLIEWGVVDPGSVNFADAASGAARGFVYLNPEEDVREALAIAARNRLRPSYAIYEPGFARLGAAMAAAHPGLPQPVYRLMFSDGFAWGFPPRLYALEAYLALLEEVAPGAPVMIAGLRVDLRPLLPVAIARGIHLRAGLEDAPLGSRKTNRQLVDAAVAAVRAAGREPAAAATVRAELAALDRAGGQTAG